MINLKVIKKYILRHSLPFLCVPFIVCSCASHRNNEENNDNFEQIIVQEERESSLSINDLPKFYREQLALQFNCDCRLEELTKLELDVNRDDSFSWIKNCVNVVSLKLNLLESVDKDIFQEIADLKKLKNFEISCQNEFYYETEEEYKEALDGFNHDSRYKITTSSMWTSSGGYISVVNDVNLNEISFDFLKSCLDVESISINGIKYSDKIDFSWLLNCANLKTLSVNLNYYQYTDLTSLKDVLLYLSDLQSFNFLSNSRYISLDEIDFINWVTSVMDYENFAISGFNDRDFRYNKVDGKYCLRVGFNDKIDYHSIDRLDIVDFSSIGVYQAAIYLSKEDIDYLNSIGAQIDLDDGSTLEDLIEIVSELDNMAGSIQVEDKNNEQEVIDAVLKYIIKNYKYDDSKDISAYYNNGYLYGVFNCDGIICGNYASLVNALLYRWGISSYYINSFNHAWNLIDIDNNYYYVDACWLDDEDNTFLESTNYDDYSWYLAEPSEAQALDESGAHKEEAYPNWIDFDNGGSLARKK